MTIEASGKWIQFCLSEFSSEVHLFPTCYFIAEFKMKSELNL